MSTPLRALWLAWGAVVALLAYPAASQTIGQQSGIMGGEAGFLRPVGGAPSATLTIDAMPYARTVTCGSYTLTGTYTGSVPTWSASPSGESGSCSDSGGGTFSCVVSVAPDASGEGVETITVDNGATDTVTIGFYVSGAHSCFLSQSVDGSYNSTLADLDPVATWENLGSSALDVTQGTGTAQPTFRTGIVGGQPVVSCDGGDLVAAMTPSDWLFLNDSAGDAELESLLATTSSDPNIAQVPWSTKSSCGSGSATDYGSCILLDDRSSLSRNDVVFVNVRTGMGSTTLSSSANGAAPSGVYSLASFLKNGSTNTAGILWNGSLIVSSSLSSTGSTTPVGPLSFCAETDNGLPFSGSFFRVAIYQSALDATQRGINQAVDEWALGGTLPVTP